MYKEMCVIQCKMTDANMSEAYCSHACVSVIVKRESILYTMDICFAKLLLCKCVCTIYM